MGLKTSETVGEEYISETDDFLSVDLSELISKSNYYEYARDVCQKRMELYYRCYYEHVNVPDIEKILEKESFNEEIGQLLIKKQVDINKDIDKFFENNDEYNSYKKYFKNNILDFYLLKLLFAKKIKTKTKDGIIKNITERNKSYDTDLGNYKYAILYYLCLTKSVQKKYAGFDSIVNISGFTIRYLLEMCNEIFESAGFDYNKSESINSVTQTEAIISVASKRIRQISAIPEIGLNIRTFIISLGIIFEMIHKCESIPVIEVNHFSINDTNDKCDCNTQEFLKQCVMRGILIKAPNNKKKEMEKVGKNEYVLYNSSCFILLI